MNTELPTPCIGTLQDELNQCVRFRARLSACSAEQIDGRTVHRLTLDDASGSVQGIIWPAQSDLAEDLCAPTFVEVDAHITGHAGRPEAHVRWLRQLGPCEIALGTDLLPIRLCPGVAHEAFSRLRILERGLPHALGCFIRDLVCDERIGVALLTAAASRDHHHAFPGGLLVHSTEMLDAIPEIMWKSAQSDPLSVPVTQVGYLLHDLGKVLGLGRRNGGDPRQGYRHEHQSLVLIEPYLDDLSRRDPRAADGVAYILGFLARHPAHRGHASFVGADVVAMLDQISTANAIGRTLSSVTTPIHLGSQAANDDRFDQESADVF